MRRLFVLFCLVASAQTDVPKFDQFPATEMFSGKPVAPVLKRAKDTEFQTMIRAGAERGPNFAGRYTVATWGCGTECVGAALIDARTGTVLDLPFSSLNWGPARFDDGARWPSDDFEPIAYNKGSRLLIVRGCQDGKRTNCGAAYYEWTDTQFKLVRKFGFAPAGEH
jgi:hypothetical protein